MLKKEDVIWAYRLYLDREPENEMVIKTHLQNYSNRKELAQAFSASDEHRKKLMTLLPLK